MSFIAIEWADGLIHTHPEVKMTQGQFNVLRKLAGKQNAWTEECQISEQELATFCRLSKTHVARCLRALKEKGALASWEKGKNEFWASKFKFGLGFEFVPLCTSDPAAVHILSLRCAHPVPKNGAPIRKENQRNLETLPPLAAAFEEFEIKDSHHALARDLGLDAGAVFAKLKDYCLANGKRYENLDAALNLWLRNERAPRAPTSPKQSNLDRAQQSVADALEMAQLRAGKKLPKASGE